MNDQKNMILAIGLSALVLIGWQYFIGMPQMEKQKQEAQLRQQQTQPPATGAQPAPGTPGTPPAPAAPGSPAQPQAAGPQVPGQISAPAPGLQATRQAVIAATPRIAIETPTLNGSIALKGGRVDDLALVKYRETVDPKSPAIVLLSPSGSPHPFYAEFGWVPGAGAAAKLPNAETVWRREGAGALTPAKPITLTWDNGEGLEFRRTIAVDDKYLFTARDEVANKGTAPVTLVPYAFVRRHGTPKTEGYYILHEGYIGVLGEQGLKEEGY